MSSSPTPQCHHIKTSGVRCGSPALREKRYCYYHQRSRPVLLNIGRNGDDVFLSWPTLEDAHSIQFALRQVSLQLLDGAIDAKKAGLLFYALQIASSNLKRMKDETPQPEQVVVDPPELSEIPRPAPTPEAVRLNSHTTRLAHLPESPSENDEYRDDIKRQARELREELAFQIAEFEGHGNEGQSQSEAPETSKPGGGLHPNDGLPDGTIQACIGERQYVN